MTDATDLTGMNQPAQQMNPQKKERSVTANRSALIQASIQAVANCGFHGASVRVIAGQAGVAMGAVFIHFEDKEHLLLETYRDVERRCRAALMTGYPLQGTFRQRFSHTANRLIRHFTLFPEEFHFVDQFLCSPYRKLVSPHFLPETALSGILQFFREGAKQQHFKAIPPAMLFALACGPLIQVVRANTAGYLYLDDERVAKTVEACWEAVSLHKVPYFRRRQEGAKASGSQPRDDDSNTAVAEFMRRQQR